MRVIKGALGASVQEELTVRSRSVDVSPKACSVCVNTSSWYVFGVNSTTRSLQNAARTALNRVVEKTFRGGGRGDRNPGKTVDGEIGEKRRF